MQFPDFNRFTFTQHTMYGFYRVYIDVIHATINEKYFASNVQSTANCKCKLFIVWIKEWRTFALGVFLLSIGVVYIRWNNIFFAIYTMPIYLFRALLFLFYSKVSRACFSSSYIFSISAHMNRLRYKKSLSILVYSKCSWVNILLLCVPLNRGWIIIICNLHMTPQSFPLRNSCLPFVHIYDLL